MRLEKWMYSKKKPVTRAEVARRVGVSKTTVENWIDKGVTPRVATAKKISKMTNNRVNRKDFI